MELTVLPFGRRALLAEVEDVRAVMALTASLRTQTPDAVGAVIPAARTVLVRFDPDRLPAAAAAEWVAHCADTAPSQPATAADEVELPVVYDGPDLAATAQALDVAVDDLIARHTGTVWTVAFTGFAPGFGYLVAEDWPFDVPRLDSPRTRVPAGSIGLAARFSGAYPRATPGGWRLIGRTGAALFDPASSEPVLLGPGTRVRFVVDEGRATGPASARETGWDGPGPAVGGGFTVIAPGPLTCVQDLGRPGCAHEGIAVAGALDRGALRAANRLVGNSEDTAGLEVTLGGFSARAERDLWVAVCGARGPLQVDGVPVDPYTPVRWPAGTVLQIGALQAGVRAVLAVRGGIEVPPEVGSRSTDTLARLGPAPLRAGRRMTVGDATAGPIPPAEPVTAAAPAGEIEVEVAPGPRASWITEASRRALFEQVWTVGGEADRVGMRLEGPTLVRTREDELPSEGMLPGAIQVPPDGRPVILLADGPVTGGYPVVGVVVDADLDLLAQAGPGTRIRFRHARPLS